ncbi:hypothetical protein DFH27DRAFT_46434 [Peziza echinospora]|nr:hypothetical protein DFH27DRAFT_46434 [Peziza echinospora]
MNIDDFLKLTKYGTDYNDMPLGTDPVIFRLLQDSLKGKLKTFGKDFVAPAVNDPNYVPPNRGRAVVIFGMTTLALASIVVLVRMCTKSLRAAGGRVGQRAGAGMSGALGGRSEKERSWEGRTRSEWEWWRPWKRWGWRFGRVGMDDWAMVVALIFLAGYTTLNALTEIYGGMGRHVYDVSLNSVRFLLKANFAHTLIYLTLSFAIKLSILLFYLKLFPVTFTKMRFAIYGLIVFFAIYTVVGCLVLSFVCKPVRAFWILELRVGSECPSQRELEMRYRGVLGVHISGDFLVLMLPLKLVASLRLPKRQKAVLVCLFCAGGAACIASILRLYYFPWINNSLDVTWNVTPIAFWGQVEASTAVICASLPALKPLMSFLRKGKKTSDLGNPTGARSLSPTPHIPAHGHKKNVSSISGMGSSARTRSPANMDPYAAGLAEIDDIDIDMYIDEYGHDLESGNSSVILARPEAAYLGRFGMQSSGLSMATTTLDGSSQQLIPAETQLRPPTAQQAQQRTRLTPNTTPNRSTTSVNTCKPLPALPPHSHGTSGPFTAPPEVLGTSPPAKTTPAPVKSNVSRYPHPYAHLDQSGIERPYWTTSESLASNGSRPANAWWK